MLTVLQDLFCVAFVVVDQKFGSVEVTVRIPKASILDCRISINGFILEIDWITGRGIIKVTSISKIKKIIAIR
jgi:hypothetical protein